MKKIEDFDLSNVSARLARFTAVDPATGCHNWTGATNQGGYGVFKLQQQKVQLVTRSHRVAYVMRHGPIPAGYEIDHLCRNTRCCNPDHLEAVTPSVNIRRGSSPAGVKARQTHCIHGHPLSGDNLILVPEGRRCRTCRNATRPRKSPRPSWPVEAIG